MTQKTRLCFRDAMYRLATNSEKQSSVIQGEHGGNFPSEKRVKTTNPDQTLRYDRNIVLTNDMRHISIC